MNAALERDLSEDTLDLIVQAGGKISETELINGLRRGARANVVPTSGRKWSLGGNKSSIISAIEEVGFTVEHEYTKKSIRDHQRHPHRSLVVKTTWITL